MVSDLVFIELSTRDSSITRFLTGKRYQQGPLRHVKVLDRLMHLRNEATDRKIKETHGGGEGSVDDLGLDGPKAKAPRRSLQSISPTIVEVDYEGTELKLLGELGTRRVWIELTPGNMKFLFDQVAEEGLGASLGASAASPAKARGTGSEDEDSTTLPPSPSRSKGITWVGSRITWVVRYKDVEGRFHSKRFRASAHSGDDCGSDGARVHALRLAEEWLEEHHERVRLGR